MRLRFILLKKITYLEISSSSPKGEEDEVFGMQIPKELITDNIGNASYYNAYLEMVEKHDRKIVAAGGGKKKSANMYG
ncbi:hypothetical protein Tco_0923934 [Tanacetum coccineum]|uniref:Uncharacterized protein n=1 Tax=Tanacetum coccineum TaxID=301880 RepID=A0ABQ5D2D2_9ASTR